MTMRMSQHPPRRRGLYEDGKKIQHRPYELGSADMTLNRAQRRAMARAERKKRK